MIQEDHCLGFNEPKQWMVRQWKEDQELGIYNEMNDLLMGVLSLKNRSHRKTLTDKENTLFHLACYDLDRFRDFAFENSLWKGSSITEDTVDALRQDDVALIRFAIEWIKGRLFGGD